MPNIEIIRFRAWLEIRDTPESDQGTVFPITSASIIASLNSIPVATVTIATGTRLQDGRLSPIHEEQGQRLRNPETWPWAKIHFRNLQTDETAVIFEGFADSSGHNFSFSSTEITLTIRHWLYALDAHPCISSITHPSSVAAFTQMLFYKSLPGSTGTGGDHDQKSGLVFRQMLDELFLAGVEGFSKDIIQNGILESLRLLTKLSEYYTPWDIAGLIDEEKILKSDVPLSIDSILNDRIKSGDTSNAQLQSNEFPILKIQSRYDSDAISERMFDALMASDSESFQLNSLWAALIQLASAFGFMLVPRVHELRFIPKWFTPQIVSPKVLKGIVSSNGTWEYSRSIGAAIVLPTSVAGKGISAIDTPGMHSLEDGSAMSVYGVYTPPHEKPGTLLIRQRSDWAGEVSFPGLVNNPYTMDQKESSRDTTTTDDQVPTAEKEADSRSFYTALAEEAYWDEILKGRRTDLVCPIRFDVCPGSTVKVRNSGDIRLRSQEKDRLATEFLGFVLSVRMTFDTINASASSQYKLSHVRDAGSENDILEHHPIYQCGPFSSASWTKDRFKTIEGSL